MTPARTARFGRGRACWWPPSRACGALPAHRVARGARAAEGAETCPCGRGKSAGRHRRGKLFGAIVKVSAHAIPDARSAATLGTEREGTGIVIGDNGLILTIGYLIVEAEEVSIVDIKGRTLSAQVVGYDHATRLRHPAHDRRRSTPSP